MPAGFLNGETAQVFLAVNLDILLFFLLAPKKISKGRIWEEFIVRKLVLSKLGHC